MRNKNIYYAKIPSRIHPRCPFRCLWTTCKLGPTTRTIQNVVFQDKKIARAAGKALCTPACGTPEATGITICCPVCCRYTAGLAHYAGHQAILVGGGVCAFLAGQENTTFQQSIVSVTKSAPAVIPLVCAFSNHVLYCKYIHVKKKLLLFWCGIQCFIKLIGDYYDGVSDVETASRPEQGRTKQAEQSICGLCATIAQL